MFLSAQLRRAVAAGFCLSAIALAGPAEAGRFTSMVVMGDSWSDDGVQSVHLKQGVEVWQLNPDLLDSASRPAGRFSNGPVMAEQVGSLYGISPADTQNYAIGGAASGSNFGAGPRGQGRDLCAARVCARSTKYYERHCCQRRRR